MINTDVNILKLYLDELNREVRLNRDLNVNALFKKLFKLERQFSSTLRSHKEGRDVYQKFCRYVLVELSDIREARSFFRERLSSYLPKVNKAISRSQMKDVYKIHINYSFCVFAMNNINQTNKIYFDKLQLLMREMKTIRNEIINGHLYLALSQAKIFSSKNKHSTLEFSDFIQCANEALMVAVDKFVLDEDSSQFYKMAIGRMVSHLLVIQTAMSSSASLGTHGTKKLHALRKMLQNVNGAVNTNELSQILKIAEQDIADLINSVKYFSLDMPVSEDSNGKMADFIEIEDEDLSSPEDLVIDIDSKEKIRSFLKTLSLIERKILLLKGVISYDDYESENT